MDLMAGAMGSLLPKLRELLKEEYKLQTSVKEDIKFVERELRSTYAALSKVAEVPREQLDELARLWAIDVRDLSYDMEDVVDTFLVRVEGSEPADSPDCFRWLLEKMINLFEKCKARHQIAMAIKAIKDRVKDVADRRDRYKMDSGCANCSTAIPAARTIDPRLSALYRNASELIGIDEARDKLMEMLSMRDGVSRQQLKIVSVFGSGGVGKTSLAKVVHDKVKPQFDCGAFVPVGQKPDLKKVFKDMLLEFDKQRYLSFTSATLDERQLIDEFREFLKGKRYFIVIDDLWDIQSWETINFALIKNNRGSRIITTTRIFKVAVEVGDVYVLEPLSHDNSEKLLYTRIFGGEGKCPDNQSDEVSYKILKKCAGVPLAIITIASLLAGKPREDWSKVDNYIGFAHDNWHMENTMRILSFSYNDLPSHLRTCLLYLSIFPEDYVIEKELLIGRWIAEGFVHKEHMVGLFEMGEGYFNELINRSMILPVDYGNQGTIGGCLVHDMVLALLRSLSQEENFVTIVDNETLSQSNSRRLALQKRQKNVEHSFQDNMGMQQVRSVNATWCYTVPPLVNFRILRVLSIEHCDLMEEGYSLKHLGNLLHLRYLGLMYTLVRELPNEIGNLKFLQMLDLRGTGLQELPRTAGLLRQLVWLRVDQKTRIPQDVIGKLTSLEELWILPAAADIHYSDSTQEPGARSFVKELGNLMELRVLRFWIDELDESMERALVESLRNMHKIRFLQIMGASVWDSSAGLCTWDAGGSFILPRHLRQLDLSCIWFSRLPSWIHPSRLPSLSYLSMAVHAVREQDLQVLGRLPKLDILHLLVRYGLGANIFGGDHDAYFQKLRICKMRCTTLRFVPSPGARTVMPRLEDLQFGVDVRGLKDANIDTGKLGLESLPSLRRVKVEIDCENASVREVEEMEALLKHMADTHPNRPTLELIRLFEDQMRFGSQEVIDQILASLGLQFQLGGNNDEEEEENDEVEEEEGKDGEEQEEENDKDEEEEEENSE